MRLRKAIWILLAVTFCCGASVIRAEVSTVDKAVYDSSSHRFDGSWFFGFYGDQFSAFTISSDLTEVPRLMLAPDVFLGNHAGWPNGTDDDPSHLRIFLQPGVPIKVDIHFDIEERRQFEDHRAWFNILLAYRAG